MRPLHARDTDRTAFTQILTDLICRIPGAHSAALVDAEGETVDYTGKAPPFDVKIAAAHFRIVLSEMANERACSSTRTLIVRAARKSFIVRVLPDTYAIVVLLGRRAGFSPTRALDACERALAAEAGFPLRALGKWTPVVVECDARLRPQLVAGTPGQLGAAVEVLGAMKGLPAGERAFRVRLETGAEVLLLRERGGAWYSEEPIDFTGRRVGLRS